MNKLLHKEFKLAVHPTSFIFLSLSAMLLIPNYPYYVVFFYQTLGVFFTFLNGNTNNDIFFTTLLPIRKRDAVRARVGLVVICELLQILVSIPFAMLRNAINPAENLAGVDANVALFGLAFILFGVFNIVFLPLFYQTAYKTGTPFMISCTAMTLFAIIAEAAIQLIPGWKVMLDTTNPAYLPQQFIVLAVGVVAFAGLTFLAYARSAKNFEALDL